MDKFTIYYESTNKGFRVCYDLLQLGDNPFISSNENTQRENRLCRARSILKQSLEALEIEMSKIDRFKDFNYLRKYK